MLIVVDYGIGNLGSIENMLRKIGAVTKISSDPDEISKADKIILPGVGSFDNGMAKLKELGLVDVLDHKAKVDKTPILGICLGMQLMACSSDEGQLPGLSWVKAKVKKFQFNRPELKIPHMGWNDVHVKNTKSKLFDNMYPEPRFYFVHSYYFSCDNNSDILTETVYDTTFTSGIEHQNIYGVQFHPEKSHKYGMRLLENFWRI